jgi:hypothetical protein
LINSKPEVLCCCAKFNRNIRNFTKINLLAFDLLFWNEDGTNLLGVITHQYLRRLCQNNEFSTGKFEIFDEVLKISDVYTPLFAVGCETDTSRLGRIAFVGLSKWKVILKLSFYRNQVISPDSLILLFRRNMAIV